MQAKEIMHQLNITQGLISMSFLKMNKVVTNLLRSLVIISSTISSVVLIILLQRSSCSSSTYHPNLPAHIKEERPLPRCNNGTTHHHHHQVVVAASSSSSDVDDDDRKLSKLLRRAAMEDNKTVIMAITNEAWTAPGSLTDLFLESLHRGVKTEPLLKHLLIVTVDAKSLERCQRVHPLCYALDVGGANFTSEQQYMARDYLDMVWRRIRLQGRVLELGYSFLHTDVDIVWFRNPLLRIPVAADITMACDEFYGENPYDLDKDANTGLVYARANARTAEFYRVWYESRSLFPGNKTQDVLLMIKHQLTERLGVTLQFVDTTYFGTFCDTYYNRKVRDLNKLCTFHANCILGLSNKVHMLRGVLNEWMQFKGAVANNGTTLN